MKTARFLGLVSLVLVAFSLAACSGDDGPAGPTGPTGPSGPPGASGPPGNSGALPVESASIINVTVTDVAVPAGGGAPTVAFTLTNELGQGLKGLPASNISFVISQLSPGINGSASEWQAYPTRSSAGIPNAQATTESGTAGTFEDFGDGTFQYTFAEALTDYPGGPTYDESKIHRVGLEIRTNRGLLPYNIPHNNGPYDFRPLGGAVGRDDPEHRLIVDNDTCNACHDQLAFHGEGRFDIEYCVTCHNPSSIDGDTADEPWGGSVNMTVMIHKIHYGVNLANGYKVVGYGGTEYDYSDIIFPQDVRNCQTCHNDSDSNTPQASNYYETITRTACGTCHDDIDWEAGDHPGGAVFPDDSFCVDCHGPNSEISGGMLRVRNVHKITTQELAKEFAFEIVAVSSTGPDEFPVVDFRVFNPLTGDNYDIHNDVPFVQCADRASRLAISVGWDTTDYTNTGSGAGPAQPISMNPLVGGVGGCNGASENIGNNVFRVTSTTAIPTDATGTAVVAFDGHPAVPVDGSNVRIPVPNVVFYTPITDGTVVARRNAVAIEKCDDCHNELSMHGNNRTDNIEVCVVCHNPNATDISRRGGACEEAFGADDQSIDMKYMIHALHAGGATGVPYDVCGYGNNPYSFDFVYPGKLNNCEGCHVEGGYYPVDATQVLGTTFDANAPLDPSDDRAVSPNTTVCSACHVSQLAADHMEQNGGDFNAMKDADSNLISSGSETCSLCHGEGRSADVGVMHGVGNFQFN